MRGICPSEALLYHVHVENIDFAEVHSTQGESTYSLVAVRLGSALVINLLYAGTGQSLQVVPMVIMLQVRLPSKQVDQAISITIHDQPKRLLL